MLVVFAALAAAAAVPRTVSARPSAAKTRSARGPDTRLVPADTALLLSIDVAGSKRGPLFPKILRLVELSEELGRGLELLRAGADIDVRRNVTRITIAIAGNFPQSKRLVYVLDGQFDPGKLAAFAKRDSKAAMALTYRGVPYYRLGGKAEVALLGSRLVIARKDAARAMIDLHLAKARATRPSKRLRGTLRTVNRSATVWMAFALPPALRAELAKKLDGHPLDSIAVSVVAHSSLRVTLRLGAATSGAAVAIAAMIRSSLPGLAKGGEAKKLGLGAALSSAKVSRSRSSVVLTLNLGSRAMRGLQTLIAR